MKTIRISPEADLAETVKNALPNTRIILGKGEYRSKLEITSENLQLIGSGKDDTVIVYDDYAKKIDEFGREYNTFRTYTAAVLAKGVRFEGLTVKNDSLRPEEKGQEVALTVYADDFRAEDCAFVSTQDTVFCGPLPPDLIERYDGFLKNSLRRSEHCRQIFKSCYIAGNVDFIFGCGDTLFDSCEIRSVNDVRGHGYAAAPAHALSQEIGFVFKNCRFTRDEGVRDGSVFLARPWRDYGKSTFIGCEYGPHIAKVGFDKWNDTERDKTARFSEYGIDMKDRAEWSKPLSEEEKDFLLSYFPSN